MKRLAGKNEESENTTDVNVYNFLLTDQYYLEMPQDTELYVYPKHIPIERLNILMQRIYGTISARERLYEDFLQFAGIREYASGDDRKSLQRKEFVLQPP